MIPPSWFLPGMGHFLAETSASGGQDRGLMGHTDTGGMGDTKTRMNSVNPSMCFSIATIGKTHGILPKKTKRPDEMEVILVFSKSGG